MVSKIPPAEREALLASPLIGVLSVAAEPGRAPLTTPIWHRYTPGGEVTVETSPNTRKFKLIEAAGRFALCVQDRATIRYVTVEGPVTGMHPITEEERLAMARNYLPEEAAIAYLKATPRQSANIVITMRPERWNTADYSDVVSGEPS
ncbi:pyridoxamine 5'-phosphate oxidase family protein [Amycolatopsis pithecellobii]|uniref:Pyridoxamine 5'-phosphate oxidase family protein n=1 Tax=Amycolatopsis pithecellobii TaxID=664692 RepID=A0A6N7YIZ0_9PSEU|nr:pyridoxamine 5'-phosphate oxidase family protein [Amycolatopsis pithecellobii]MTD52885.1 pyridoxamine 5'-phosphate oxidase family protein [Amycolatopsis pithecellobii]